MPMISKKDLLKKTHISYGQLYRWKREGLIPEEWFIKQSVTTGQETFFDEDLIIPRIEKILSLKESDYSIEKIKNVLNPEIKDITFSLDKIRELKCFDERIVKKLVGKQELLNINEIVILYALSLARKERETFFYHLKFDLTLEHFKDFSFHQAKMALISKKHEGFIIFFDESLLLSDLDVDVQIYDLTTLEQEVISIIKQASYKN